MAVKSYIVGLILEMIAVSVLTSIGLMIIGVRHDNDSSASRCAMNGSKLPGTLKCQGHGWIRLNLRLGFRRT